MSKPKNKGSEKAIRINLELPEFTHKQLDDILKKTVMVNRTQVVVMAVNLLQSIVDLERCDGKLSATNNEGYKVNIGATDIVRR